MFDHLEITNYRRFASYRVDGLRRVNLLVGRNNSGKTTVLEAVSWLVADKFEEHLARLAFIRGMLPATTKPDGWTTEFKLDTVSATWNLFHGYQPTVDGHMAIVAGPPDYKFEIGVSDAANVGRPTGFEVSREGPGRDNQERTELYSTKNDVSRSFSNEFPALTWDRYNRVTLAVPGMFLPPHRTTMKMLARMWNRFVIEGPSSEERIVSTLKALDERIEDLRPFVGSDSDSDDIVVRLTGMARRVPVGTLGDGMRHLLSLALALAGPAGGTLMVDEIETGLHYGLMADLWKLVVTGALQSDIQVFATTHSADCIRGLHWLSHHRPELFDEVAVVKIVPSLPNAITLSGEDLRVALHHDLEMR